MHRDRPFHQLIAQFATGKVATASCALLVLAALAGVSPAQAADLPKAAASVQLGTAAGFSVLAGGITSTGTSTVLALDLGATGVVTGFPPGVVTGTKHIADDEATTAQEDRQSAYESAAAQTGGTAFGGDLAGTTFTPGLYSTAAAVTNTGTITLDANGDPSAKFVFQVGAALSSAAGGKVVLTNGALANNVYWQVVGAVALGANVKWVGTVLGAGVVSLGGAASLKGRILTSSTVTLANSPITKPIDDLVAPVVTVNGGLTRSTSDTTPSISGTTDEPGTPLVTVKVGEQVLTTRSANGAWALSANALSSGPHDLLASVSDPSGNTGTATQVLTVDTSAPAVSISGGAATATKDTTPTITGTTDEAGTPAVTVSAGSQTLHTTAAADGTWSVEAATLTETSHFVQASVGDAAGNTGTANQVLTVDLTVPVVTIDGGTDASTSDSSPWIYGTTAEQAGTLVHLTLGGQALTATVQPGGTWGVSAETLVSGSYSLVGWITDAARNTGTATQRLQIGSVASNPVIAPPSPTPTPSPTPIPTPMPTRAPKLGPALAPSAAAELFRPDAEIRLVGRGFVGQGDYTGSRQRVATTVKGRPARAAMFQVRMTNRGNTADQIATRGTSGSKQFIVAYLYGSRNVSAAVLNGSFHSPVLRPGQSVLINVKATKVRGAKKGSARTFSIRVASTHDARKLDTVSAALKVTR